MKVIIIGTAYPYKGGIASFNERMAKEYKQQGHDVEIVTFTLQYPKFLYPGTTQYSDEPAPQGISIKRMINSVNPLTWIKAARYIRKQKPDLLISKFWLPVMGPALGTTIKLGKTKKTKAIAIIDNIIPHESRPGDRPFTTYFLNQTDGCVVMSHKVESDMQQFDYNKPITYAPHPIYDNYGEPLSREEAIAKLGLNTEHRFLLFFGFIRKYKGLDILLNAFAKVADQLPDVRLIVAGEYYTDGEVYLQQIADLGIKERVILRTDFIPNDAVGNYFSAADLVAQTYRSATQSGISQIAIHFEKPILSTNVGGLPETTIDGVSGYLVPVDEAQIAMRIMEHFGSGQPNDFTKGIQKLKEAFSWPTFVQKTIETIHP